MKVRSWIVVAVLVALVAGVVVARRTFLAPAPAPPAKPQLAENSSEPPANMPMAKSGIPTKTLMAPQLPATLRNGKPTLVDFGAGTCTQCKREAPVLDAAVENYRGKANVLFVDTSKYEPVAYQYGVKLIPTQIFFDAQGKEVSRHIGFHPAEAVAADFAKAGVKE